MFNRLHNRYLKIFIVSILFILLYFVSIQNYLLFHSITELYSVCIAFVIFSITFHSLKYLKNNYMIIIGLAYLFIAFLDLLHTLGYKGMGVFTDYDYYANQLWIAARFFESIVFLVAIISIKWKRVVNYKLLILIFTIITILSIISIFFTDLFPVCFIEGEGQTTFKIVSEYIINLLLLSSLLLMWKNKAHFSDTIYKYVRLSLIFTIMSELFFTFYISNYGVSNMLGHYSKICSFYFIYKAIIVKCLNEPHESIFNELNQAQTLLAIQNQQLKNEVILDSLTRLYNHSYLFECVNNQIKQYHLFGHAFCVAFIDLDGFKEINDHCGHLVGDRILIEVADILKQNSRQLDIVSRFGGDEFCIMLVDANLEQGKIVATKINKIINATQFCYQVDVTVSIGIAEYTTGTAEDLFKASDEKLYEAKANGKNRVM